MGLTQKYLKDILCYNPDLGHFVWLISKPGVSKGTIAGSLDIKNGYEYIMINRKKYVISKLAFLYMMGYWPENEIDHINRIKNDNRWNNLRHVSHQVNSRNRGVFKNNSSGVVGVSYVNKFKKWYASITVKGKTSNLGYYENFTDAVSARLSAEISLNWHEKNLVEA